jgi:CubicO group peptidase (beta-lactamase class C family)
MHRLLYSLLALAALTHAQDFPAKFDEYLRAQAALGRFSGSVLAARSGEIVHVKGYEQANREHGVANTPATRFRIGSVTKQFTAAAILQLVEEGKLSLDAAAGRFVPDSHPDWKKVTVRHLLNHTSGIPSFTGFKEYREIKRKEHTSEAVVALFKDRPLEFEPGSQFRYNNSGYFLLGYIIEKVTGRPYGAHLKERIFTPLELNGTGADDNRAILNGRAAGYTRDAGGAWRNADYIDMTVPGGAGSLYSTVEDLHRWNEALHSGKVVSGKLLEEMRTPGKGNYGYGLLVAPIGKRKAIHHGGGIEGFNTVLAWFPEERLTVAALSNVNTPAMPQIAADLAAIALGDPYQLPKERKAISLDPKTLDRYTGRYELGPNFILTVRRDGDRLLTQATGQSEAEIFAETETKFFLKVVDAQITFVSDGGGPAESLILHQNGRDIPGKRIGE